MANNGIVSVGVAVGVAAMLLCGGSGCKGDWKMSTPGVSMKCPVQRIRNAPPDMPGEAPLLVDQAMQIRDWDRSTALYANGDTIAGNTGFWYQPRWGQPEWVYPMIETPLFVGQTLALPVTLAIQPPWKQVRYTGVTMEPTYSGMPPLPQSGGVDASPVEAEPQPQQSPPTQP